LTNLIIKKFNYSTKKYILNEVSADIFDKNKQNALNIINIPKMSSINYAIKKINQKKYLITKIILIKSVIRKLLSKKKLKILIIDANINLSIFSNVKKFFSYEKIYYNRRIFNVILKF